MHWHSSRLINDDYVVILAHNADRLSGDWRLMAMESMADNIAIFYYRVDPGGLLPVHSDVALLYSSFLTEISQRSLKVLGSLHVVLLRSISELGGENP